MTELEQMQKDFTELRAEVARLRRQAEGADDYRQIVNAMMGHVYSYYNHSERKDLEDYWVRSRDDIVYAHNDRAYVGRQGVWEYYIDGTDANKKRYAENAKRLYHVDTPEGAAAGYRVIHLLGSPYVEIAGDRKTAQGIWMSLSFMSNMGRDGAATPSYVLQRFSGEFLREEKWRLWHVRDYTDVTMRIETPTQTTETVEWGPDGCPVERKGPPVGVQKGSPVSGPMPAPPKEDGDRIRRLILDSANMYEPWTHTVNEPAIPMPYEAWNPEQTYIRIVPEQKNGAEFQLK